MAGSSGLAGAVGDWLTTVGPFLRDMWWDEVLNIAGALYRVWLGSEPMERLRLVAVSPPAFQRAPSKVRYVNRCHVETQGCVVSKTLKYDIKQRIFTRQSTQKTARSDLPRIGEAVTTTKVEATNTLRYSLTPHLATSKAKHLEYGGREVPYSRSQHLHASGSLAQWRPFRPCSRSQLLHASGPLAQWRPFRAPLSLMVAWAESDSVGSTWTQACLEKLELAAETIRLIFFVLGDDASLGPLSYLYVLIRRARVQIISNGECTGDDITTCTTLGSFEGIQGKRPPSLVHSLDQGHHPRASIDCVR